MHLVRHPDTVPSGSWRSHKSLTGPFRSSGYTILQALPRAGEPGHHGPDWQPGDLRDILVRQFFQLPHHQYAAKLRRKGLHTVAQARKVSFGCQLAPGRGQVRAVMMDFFIERYLCHSVFAAAPGETGVTYHCQQPRFTISAPEAVEVAERAQIGLLNDIFRIVLVAREPMREVVSRVQMR